MDDIFTITGNGEEFGKLIQLLQHFAAAVDTDIVDNADMKLLFKVSDKTLYRWRKKEYLPYTKIGGKFYYSKKILYATLYQRLLNRYPAKDLPGLI